MKKYNNILLSSKKYKLQRDYWMKNLFNLESQRMFHLTESYTVEKNDCKEEGNVVYCFPLSPSLSHGLIKLSKDSAESLYVIILAAFIGFLNKYTQKSDIVVGIPVYQNSPQHTLFNHLVLIRMKVTPNLTFKEILLHVRDKFLEAAENQEYPFEKILEELNFLTDKSYDSLFEVVFASESLHFQTLEEINRGHANLILSVDRAETGINIIFRFRACVFHKKEIQRISKYLKRVLEQVMDNLSISQCQVDLLTDREVRQLLYDFNDTTAQYPKDKAIHQLFEEQVALTPHHTALVFEGQHLTYKGLNQRANQLVRLLKRYGVSPDSIAGIMTHHSLEMVEGIFAVLKTGAAYLPIDNQYPEGRINYILKDSNINILLTQSHIKEKFQSQGKCILLPLDEMGNETGDGNTIENSNPVLSMKPGNIAYVIYTSGSTGRPKGTLIEHCGLVNYIWAVKEHYITDSKDVFALFSPLAFDFTVTSIFTPLVCGNYSLIYHDDGSEFILYRILQDNIVTVLKVTPAHLLILRERDNHDSQVKTLVVGGEDFKRDLAAAIYKSFGRNIAIYNEYGPTETVVGCMLHQYDFQTDLEISVPIGAPIRNMQIYNLDKSLEVRPVGTLGEIYIAGDGVARGYLNRPELTSEKFIHFMKPQSPINPRIEVLPPTPATDGNILYKSGDLARFLDESKMVYSGRIDHQLIVRGYRIEPGEIEMRLKELENIEEAVVVGKDDGRGDRYLCAYIVSKDGDLKGLKSYLSGLLPEFLIPSYFIPIDTIPLTTNGKLDLKALPEPETAAAGKEYEAPRNWLEERLVDIWSEILLVEKEKISINANFWELGGHSLKATILTTRIHKTFKVKLPLAEIFKTPTISELAQYIKGWKKDRYMSIPSVEKKEYYPLSPAQRRLYFLQQLVSDNTGYNMPYVIPLQEAVDKEKLETIFRRLITRHESFRTSFKIVNQEPVQQVHKKVEFAIDDYETTETGKESTIANFKKPFDLSRAPLLRVDLLNLNASQQVLLIDMHHILTDGTAQDILQKEFMALYSEPGKELVPLRLQCKDYSEWQNSLNQKELIKQQQEYWLKEFPPNEEVPVLKLPTDYIRPVMQDFEGNRVDFTLNTIETRALKNTTEENGVTLYMCLLAVLNVLFFKLSGQEDIIIGTPIAARRHTDLQQIIGMLVNTLAMRNYPSGDKTFAAFLKEVRQRTLHAYENQEYPFEMLVDKISVQRDTSRNPLFDVMLNLLNQSENRSGIEEINDQPPYRHQEGESIFDLVFNVIDLGHTIFFNLEYSTRLFAPATIERFIKYLKNMISSLPANMGKRLADIEMLAEEEKKEILRLSVGINRPCQGSQTIHQWFEKELENIPTKTALVFGEKHLTYRELNQRANRLAGMLGTKGVGPDDVVGLMIERSLEMIIAVLAVLKAGGAYLPIDPGYPKERILFMLADSGTSVVLTSESILKRSSIDLLKKVNNYQPGIAPIVTPPRKPVHDLDSLPIPDRSLVDYKKYHKYIALAMAKHTVSILTSRGCPFGCIYCNKVFTGRYVTRSAGNIFAEIKNCYEAGIRRFAFIDDVFNLDEKNAAEVLNQLIKNRMEVQLFFPNGLRGDILTKEFIDLMIEAGTVTICLALESASPRIQKLIKKNLNLEKFIDNVHYITREYPQIILEMELMHGFPTETEEEAMMTLDFLMELKWVHFPNLHILKIYPQTKMYQLAVNHGISEKQIARSVNLSYHQIPETLPFSKNFTRNYQARFLNEYFFLKERLNQVLSHQMKVLTEDELLQKYDSYLPMEIKCFTDILQSTGLSMEELGYPELLRDDHMGAPDFSREIARYFPKKKKRADAFRVLLLDLSLSFTAESTDMLYDVVEAPLGLMYLLTYLNEKFGEQVCGKISKSRIDFDNFAGLRNLVMDFKPDLIGIRTLSLYKDFFHRSVLLIRQWGVDAPIVGGGPYATTEFTAMLQDVNVDLAVLGEGELTLADLIERMMNNGNRLPNDEVLKQINGIAFIKKEDKSLLNQLNRNWILVDNLNQQFHQQPGDNLPPVNTDSDMVYVIYTSGSTGKPKGAVVEHRNLVNLFDYQFKYTNIDCTRVLQFATISFDASFHEIFSALLSEGTLYLINRETRDNLVELFKYIEKNEIKTVFMPMSFLRMIFNEDQFITLFPRCVTHIQTAGEQVIISEKFKRFLKENNVYLHNHYGPSETHVVTALTLDPRGEIPQLPSIGKPILNTDIYILDKGNHLLPQGVPGELCIGGIQLGRGYLDRPELTFEKFCLRRPGGDSFWKKPPPPGPPSQKLLIEKFAGKNHENHMQPCSHTTMPSPHHPITPLPHSPIYRTGDLARWRKDGNIEFLGRTDHQVKIRGFRIELEEIENRLLSCEGIKEAVVVVRENDKADKYLCAYVSAGKELTVSALRATLMEKLPDYMVPVYFVKLEHIPLTPSGKIDRKALPEPQLEANADYQAPRDQIEEKLVEIWSEILGLNKEMIGIDTNFFAIGGHSLKATSVIYRVNNCFNMNVPMVELFKAPYIRQMGEYIKHAAQANVTPPYPDKNLLLLRQNPGKAGNIFFIHDGTGDVEGYVEMCKDINIDNRCWGIRANRLENHTPVNLSIENIAADYIKTLRKVQAHGPYFISGWSLGGVIAFEMALQLETSGENISFLGLIDAPSPQSDKNENLPPFTLETEINLLMEYLPDDRIKEKVRHVSHIDEIWSIVVNYLEENNYSADTIKTLIPGDLAQIIPNYDQANIKELIYYLNINRTLIHALSRYIPGVKIDIPVHYFKASESPGLVKKGWDNYCKKSFEILQVRGDHFSILRKPAVKQLGKIFAAVLKKNMTLL